jgi:hypothetical protein
MTLHLMEPELEELLHEIARDPRSTLLRVDRPTILRGLFDRDPMVRESCTQLTSAERQLLRVHRSELGQSLRLTCFDALDSNESSQLCYCHDHGAQPFPVQPGSTRTIRETRRLASNDPNLKRRSLVESAVNSTDPLQLAIAACRVLPNMASYLLLSDAYQVRGDSASDLASLKMADQLSASTRDQAHIKSYLAFHHALHDRLLLSIDCYRDAYRLSDEWPNEVLSWLLLSARCMEASRFDAAASAIAHSLIKEQTLTRWTSTQRTRRDEGHWTASSEMRAFLSRRTNIQSEQVLYVLDELFAAVL